MTGLVPLSISSKLHRMSTAWRAAFREWFGLTSAATEVLVALYAARGAAMSPADIAHVAAVSPGAVPFHLTAIRSVLEAESLDHERGAGYRLTDQGLSECRSALWRMGEELRRAG